MTRNDRRTNSPGEARKARLAQKLRENLRRRKEQSRERREGAGTPEVRDVPDKADRSRE